MGTILSQRERWIIRREDGKILCGLAQNYVFKAPEELQSTAIKTYRSKKQAFAAFDASWGSTNFEIEAVKVRETLEILEQTEESTMQKWSDMMSNQILDKAKSLAEKAQSARSSGLAIYPPQSQIFQALTLTPPEKVRVVIVGQDPYHGPGQANGLAFSVSPGIPIPPSLRNIFREMHEDIGARIPESGDLTSWAEQGVLLLNTVLTVQGGMPNSHRDWGWQEFVLEVFRLCVTLPQPVVFLLWGRQAQSFVSGLPIDKLPNKKVLCSSHPSPLGAGKGSAGVPAFLGSRPFSKTNQLLGEMGAKPVKWEL